MSVEQISARDFGRLEERVASVDEKLDQVLENQNTAQARLRALEELRFEGRGAAKLVRILSAGISGAVGAGVAIAGMLGFGPNHIPH